MHVPVAGQRTPYVGTVKTVGPVSVELAGELENFVRHPCEIDGGGLRVRRRAEADG